MELKDQCCTREQGEKLESLGVKSQPCFSHCIVSTGIEDSEPAILPVYFELTDRAANNATYIAPAFTASELGQLLPAEIIKDDYTYSLDQQKFSNEWRVSYMAESETMSWELNDQCSISANEAEARAAMLIYLLENKLLNPSQSTNQ